MVRYRCTSRSRSTYSARKARWPSSSKGELPGVELLGRPIGDPLGGPDVAVVPPPEAAVEAGNVAGGGSGVDAETGNAPGRAAFAVGGMTGAPPAAWPLVFRRERPRPDDDGVPDIVWAMTSEPAPMYRAHASGRRAQRRTHLGGRRQRQTATPGISDDLHRSSGAPTPSARGRARSPNGASGRARGPLAGPAAGLRAAPSRRSHSMWRDAPRRPRGRRPVVHARIAETDPR